MIVVIVWELNLPKASAHSGANHHPHFPVCGSVFLSRFRRFSVRCWGFISSRDVLPKIFYNYLAFDVAKAGFKGKELFRRPLRHLKITHLAPLSARSQSFVEPPFRMVRDLVLGASRCQVRRQSKCD